ncbi:MAG: SH3 domain-containing protein [Vulcanococcus sp.]|jgi:hypothetical protein|uniref:SH3 domain-containing protein n=1 Tax=Vulcanococcus sp. DEBay_Sum29NL08_54 TaxID=2806303 RepID=UPI0025D1BA3F|nr:SH3 domain-containing protein [Vulcanococcus sp. DEBay_Sum29NL08_54]MDA0727590.1 SH3 domain-containing protein [Cyanobacteriota bacterium]
MAAQPYASLRWGAILAFALFAPVALPAGGGERRQAEIRRRCASDPFFSTTKGCLQASPERQAPVLAQVPVDSPIEVLRTWRNQRGERWLQVKVASRRGWMAAA